MTDRPTKATTAPTTVRRLKPGVLYRVVLSADPLYGEFCAVFAGWDTDGVTDEFAKQYADTLWDNGVRLAGHGFNCWEMNTWTG